jgi:hypothetical protein
MGILVAISFIMTIVWICVPFAIFGTKDRLDTLIAEAQKTNADLAIIRKEFVKSDISGAINEAPKVLEELSP